MIPERFMKFSKPVKVLILILHIFFVFPFAISWFVLQGILETLVESLHEIKEAVFLLPRDCLDFVKYSNMKEKRKAKRELEIAEYKDE